MSAITSNLLRMILIDKFLKVDRVLCVLVPLVLFSCLQQPLLNRHLFTSIGYYTGEIGVVDDSIARDHLEIAVLERDTLSLMWLARVYSTGRMGFPKDSTRALSIAKLVIDDVAKRAENGEPEAPKHCVLQGETMLFNKTLRFSNYKIPNRRDLKLQDLKLRYSGMMQF